MKHLKLLRILVQLALFVCVNIFFFCLAGGLGLVVKVQLLPAVLAMNLVVIAAVLGLTLLLGRFYCSTVCPMGAVQDFVLWLRRRLARKGRRIVIAPVRRGRTVRTAALGVSIALIAFGFVSLGALFDGYSLYGRIATAIFLPLCHLVQNAVAALQANGGHPYLFREEIFVRGATALTVAAAGLAGVVLLAWFRGRWFCNTLCPVGAALSFVSMRPLVKLSIRPEACVSCGLCAATCATGAIDVKAKTVDNAACVRCLNCIPVCRKNALKLKIGLCTAVLLVAGVAEAAAPDLTADLQLVCDPSYARWGTGNALARSVMDLQVYHDRIYPGMGEWGNNSGPVYAMAIDPFAGTCSNEYTMGTESCETIRVLADGCLHFPATDMRDGHAAAGYWFRRNAAGEWYTRTGSLGAWKISQHVWDFTYFEGRYFAAGYGIASSKDGGVTWTDVNPAWKGVDERFCAFIVCGDELFARTQRYIPFNKTSGEMVVSSSYPAIYHHWNKTTERFDTITNSYSQMNAGVKRSDYALGYSSTTLASATTADGHVWHATPFKNRCLYVLGSGKGISMFGPNYSVVTYAPVGSYPAALISAWTENGELKGQRVTLETGAYPYDITVADGAAYVLTFKYKDATSKMVEHAVWRSTDGITFTKLFTFDFQQVMGSLEYHWGYFYFGAVYLNAQPYLGTLQGGITDKAGSVYRVWCPQEPASGSVPKPAFSGQGGQAPHVMSAGVFSVSLANAVADVTYGVYLTESLSDPNWRCVQTVKADSSGTLAFVVETARAPSCFVKVETEPLR